MKVKKMLCAVAGFVSLSLTGQLFAEGGTSRYNLDRYYHSEISAAEAYLEMMQNKSTLIDVRRLREYAAGHPERAYNVPYPHIVGSPKLPNGDPNPDYLGQDPEAFYWEVYDIVKGKVDAPITTLCRTGARSVGAGNILADPDRYLTTQGLEPFTNVRNIWEGFVGQYKYAYAGGNIAHDDPDTGAHFSLDLNNNGVMDTDEPDVYSHTADSNPDKDGWRNFQMLPWSTKIRKPLAYLQDRKLYEEYQE